MSTSKKKINSGVTKTKNPKYTQRKQILHMFPYFGWFGSCGGGSGGGSGGGGGGGFRPINLSRTEAAVDMFYSVYQRKNSQEVGYHNTG